MQKLPGSRQEREDTPPQAMIPCFEPATGKPLGEVPVDDARAVIAAVARSRQAQERWALSRFSERRRVLRCMLDHVLEHADELCELVSRDAGKTLEHAMLGEILPVCEKLRWTAAHGEKHLRPERISSGLLLHKRAHVEFQPLGVIGVICPWNYPLQNILGPTISALMAGNGAVIKASELVAYSSRRVQRIFDEALTAAGYSTDLIRIVNGYGPTGAALVSSGVDKVIFTGSMENGRRVIEASAVNMTPLTLELGGNDALIVCDDAHLEQAAHAAMAGVFIAAGQNCLAAERILIFDDVYDAFVARVTELVSALRQGPPAGGGSVDIGALVSPHQLDRVEALVNAAVAQGARVLVGGKRALADQGQFFEPTVLTDVTEEMEIMREETFGPVMVLVRVPGEAEAIALTNRTPYGLGCTIMTKDPKRARRMAEQVVVGAVSVNEFGLTYLDQHLPFGGVRGSGFGRLNGRDGLRACTNYKSVLLDRFPLHAPSRLFPVGRTDYAMAHAAFHLLYGRGLTGRLKALGKIVRLWSDK